MWYRGAWLGVPGLIRKEKKKEKEKERKRIGIRLGISLGRVIQIFVAKAVRWVLADTCTNIEFLML